MRSMELLLRLYFSNILDLSFPKDILCSCSANRPHRCVSAHRGCAWSCEIRVIPCCRRR